MKHLILIFAALAFVSCSKIDRNDRMILGEWKVLGYETNLRPFEQIEEVAKITFYKDGTYLHEYQDQSGLDTYEIWGDSIKMGQNFPAHIETLTKDRLVLYYSFPANLAGLKWQNSYYSR